MKKVAMKVAMLVGMVMLNVIAGFYYDSGSGLDAKADARLSGGGDVHVCDDNFPPPTWP
jgi:hypothetical protein